jgi:hypothetical protein
MQYLYEKLQRHNLVTLPATRRAPGRPDLGFRHSCSNSGIACVFLRKAKGPADRDLRQAVALSDERFQ